MRKEKEMGNFDIAEKVDKIQGKTAEKIARVAIATGVGLAGCTPTLLRPNEPIETPSQGQALAIGLLNEQSINNLPDGEVKTSFINELNDIKKDCTEIPGCLTDTIQIYRVNVNDPEEGTNVFSYHFANIDDSEGLRTQILSVTDGKTREKTEINEDLVAKDTVIEGIPTRVFGYVDDNGNSHYLLVDREVSGQNQFQIYDAEGTSYDVITQNEKEVQAYSSFWSAPGIVEAAPLPTNIPTAEVTPTEASTPTTEAPITFEKYTFQEGDTMEAIAEKYNIEVSDILNYDNDKNLRFPGYIGAELSIPSRSVSEAEKKEQSDVYLQEAPELENYTKTEASNGFVFYKNNETNEIDRVWDTESNEILGYSVSNSGNILLTGNSILTNEGMVYVKDDEYLDESIEFWKSEFIRQGNPYGIREDTPIQIEYRESNIANPWGTERVYAKYPNNKSNGVGLVWTKSGSLRLIVYSVSYNKLGENLDLRQPSLFTCVALFYNQPKYFKYLENELPHLIGNNLEDFNQYSSLIFNQNGYPNSMTAQGAVVIR